MDSNGVKVEVEVGGGGSRRNGDPPPSSRTVLGGVGWGQSDVRDVSATLGDSCHQVGDIGLEGGGDFNLFPPPKKTPPLWLGSASLRPHGDPIPSTLWLTNGR